METNARRASGRVPRMCCASLTCSPKQVSFGRGTQRATWGAGAALRLEGASSAEPGSDSHPRWPSCGDLQLSPARGHERTSARSSLLFPCHACCDGRLRRISHGFRIRARLAPVAPHPHFRHSSSRIANQASLAPGPSITWCYEARFKPQPTVPPTCTVCVFP